MFVTAVCVLFLIKLRWPKKKRILKLIGKYQSECTLPHQSETPFVGERSFSNEQSVRAGGFFFPLPLPQFFFLSPTLGKLFTSPQLPTVFLFQDDGLNIRWKYISTRPAKIRLHCKLWLQLSEFLNLLQM